MYLPTSIPSPDPVLSQLHLGPLTIHTYALCILAGIVAAIVITQKRLARRGGNPEIVLDVVLWCVPLGLVGARFYHVFTHISDYFYPGADPWDIIKIWDGGNALYGSLLGGALGVYIGCRRAGIRFLSFADAVAPALLVAQSIGRLGNWFNHELFGLPTTLPWGLQIESSNPNFPSDAPIGTLFHPLFLYEIIWNLIGVAIILFLERKIRARWGRSLGLYLIWYGMGRSWLEAIRIDPTSDGFLGIPANMWTSFAAIALGLIIFIVQGIRHRGPEDSVYRPGFEPTDGPQDTSTTTESGSAGSTAVVADKARSEMRPETDEAAGGSDSDAGTTETKRTED